jgi:hypothetical protein
MRMGMSGILKVIKVFTRSFYAQEEKYYWGT